MSETVTETYSVNMEKLNAWGLQTRTGWGHINPTEKVSHLFDRSGGWGDWRHYRLAYGVQKGRANPTQLKWALEFTPEYDPTIKELFRGITLKEGECYFTLSSRLDVKNRDVEACKRYVEDALYRFQDLYMHMPAPASAAAVEHDTSRPASPRERDTGGGSRHRKRKQPRDMRTSISDLLDTLSQFR